jgi:DNA adenine methylase
MQNRPFLKWAGNKYPLIERIRAVLPSGKRLVEPFAGSGSVFLNTDYSRFLLVDSNADLISLFTILKREDTGFIDECKKLFVPEANDKAVYYERRRAFNETKDPESRAALFVYLNRHAYNGLCRYNSKHIFNAPFGRYSKVYFPQKEMEFFAKKAKRAEFVCGDFFPIMAKAQKGDVVYCDPPYVPLSATSNFTSYGPSTFGPKDQQRLTALARELASKGIPVLISNHDTENVQAAYQSAQIHSFEVRRSISCKATTRGRVREVLALFSK